MYRFKIHNLAFFFLVTLMLLDPGLFAYIDQII